MPATWAVNGDGRVVADSPTLGGRNPLLVENTSNTALESGVLVLIPTCDKILEGLVKNKANDIAPING
jgi:hypothetical protein